MDPSTVDIYAAVLREMSFIACGRIVIAIYRLKVVSWCVYLGRLPASNGVPRSCSRVPPATDPASWCFTELDIAAMRDKAMTTSKT